MQEIKATNNLGKSSTKDEKSIPVTNDAPAPSREERLIKLHLDLLKGNPERDIEVQIGDRHSEAGSISVKSSKDTSYVSPDTNKGDIIGGVVLGFFGAAVVVILGVTGMGISASRKRKAEEEAAAKAKAERKKKPIKATGS